MEGGPLKEFVPGLAGVPAVRSCISFADGQGGRLSYRGIPIEALAERSDFAETAWLLIRGGLPTAAQLSGWRQEVAACRRLPAAVVDVLRALPRSGHPMKALQASLAALGMLGGDQGEAAGAGEAPGGDEGGARARSATVRLLAVVPSIVAAFHRIRGGRDPVEPREDLGHAEDFLRMLTGEIPDSLVARSLDVSMILHAEHTLNASTFGALVTTSTLADPCSVLCTAVGTLSGRLHGGANERVVRMLREIGTVERVAPYVEARLAAGERIMGVGHRVYKTKDPRARILQRLAIRLFEHLGPTPLYGVAEELERVVVERLGLRGIHPNVDFYSGLVYDRMGIPADLYTSLFAVARTAGWLAHWVEQTQDNRLFRPTQVYTGGHDQPYVQVSERG